MKFSLALVSLVVLQSVTAKIYFQEGFGAGWDKRWTHSSAKSDLGKFTVDAGKFYADAEASKGLKTSQDAKFYAISAPIETPFTNENKPLVIQFEVKHEQNIDCGGGYIKLLPKTDPAKFEGDSPYYVMFGPDICGMTKKVHLIFGYKGKNLLWKKEPRCESDQFTHLYTVVINPDHTYEMHIDGEKKESGNLEDDWDFLPPKEIDDPTDKKPADWVDEEMMDDPESKKPANWDDEPEMIADPDAKQPEDWDEEEDGAWEAPMIKNPAYKGVWKPARIKNPGYKGVWAAKRIPNPEYHPDPKLHVFKDIASVGFDLWQVKSGTIFDNIVIADSVDDAKAVAKDTYEKNKSAEKKMKDDQDAEQRSKDEETRKSAEADKAEDDDDDDEADDEL